MGKTIYDKMLEDYIMGKTIYQELLEKAEKDNSTVEDRIELFKFFEKNCNILWNGECYRIDKNRDLYPVYKPVGEPDEDGDYMDWELVDAEIR